MHIHGLNIWLLIPLIHMELFCWNESNDRARVYSNVYSLT